MTVVEINGIRLNVEQAGSGPPLLLLHGFTGSATSWQAISESFCAQFTTYAVDIIGHGDSDAPDDPQRYRMERCVEDLVALMDHLDLPAVNLLGYSMGGRVALHLALYAPERITQLILESASPGIVDTVEREARVRADEALAESIEREGVAAFVERWERLPLFASQEGLPFVHQQEQRRQRLRNSVTGLANSLRGMGAGAMEPVVERLGELQMPVMLIVGELDQKYCELGRMMVSAIPEARLEIVPGAGHTVHVDQPAAFGRLVLDYLRREEHVPG